MANIFGFIIHPMELGLIWLAIAVGSAGIGIILFTIFVRLVLAPLNIVQLRNAKAMQRLQPKIAELRQRHGKDREAISKATMELYKEHRINPAMGCAPLLLQFPILIGLFYALIHLGQSPTGYPHAITYAKTVCSGYHIHSMSGWLQHCYAISGATGHPKQVFDLFHARFLWLSNGLGKPDSLFILPILAGVSQWVQSRMMLTKSADPQQQTMNSLMNFMPLMIVFFATRYASGLSLYWVTSTVIGILIQYRITGWGLLPETLRSLSNYLPGGGGGGSRSTQPRPSPKGGTAQQIAPSKEVELNGKGDSQTTPESTSPVVRTRKKANRARGGRGGRRG